MFQSQRSHQIREVPSSVWRRSSPQFGQDRAAQMAVSRRSTMASSGSGRTLYYSQFNKIRKPSAEGGAFLAHTRSYLGGGPTVLVPLRYRRA